MGIKFTNNATTTLASGISSSATSLSVQSGAGGLFPTLTAGDYFYCTLANTSGNVEIVQVTARSADTFTVVRGYDNTAAMAWNAGDKVELRVVAATFNDINTSIAGTQTTGDARYAGSMPNFTASTTSNLISASLGTGKVDFRNAVLTNGTPVEYNVTSTLTLAMNSTAASLGATTAVATTLVYAIVYNAGAPQVAVCNIHGGLQLDETNLITTTAIGSGSTAANVWYSTSAIATASQYRIIGLVNATWTSGTGWSSPTLVQPVSATASVLLSSMFTSSLGNGGWKKYPDASSPTGYFIEQWGSGLSAASVGAQFSVTFPIAFPNATLHVDAIMGVTSATTSSVWLDSSATPLTTAVFRSNIISNGMSYRVTGY